MANLSELWDEKKYSEGDPIRQLIAASKAYKDWPVDAVAWGADLVDLGSSGLSHILKGNKGLSEAVKTELGPTLRRAIHGNDRKELGMSEGPAPDLEGGRSVGRMLNPAFLLQGDVPGLSRLSNAVKDNRFSQAKRQFIMGRNKAFEDKANEAIYAPAADLLGPVNDVVQTPVDRRSFLKGSAAVGGAAAAGGLLGKFGRAGEILERTPEAVRGVKAAEQAAPKYKYNSLKEYLEYVNKWAKEDFKAADLSGQGARYSREEFAKRQLLNDEFVYKIAKDNLARSNPKKDFKTGLPPQSQVDLLDAFSPQAKREMKDYKSHYDGILGDSWADSYIMNMYLDDVEKWGGPQF